MIFKKFLYIITSTAIISSPLCTVLACVNKKDTALTNKEVTKFINDRINNLNILNKSLFPSSARQKIWGSSLRFLTKWGEIKINKWIPNDKKGEILWLASLLAKHNLKTNLQGTIKGFSKTLDVPNEDEMHNLKIKYLDASIVNKKIRTNKFFKIKFSPYKPNDRFVSATLKANKGYRFKYGRVGLSSMKFDDVFLKSRDYEINKKLWKNKIEIRMIDRDSIWIKPRAFENMVLPKEFLFHFESILYLNLLLKMLLYLKVLIYQIK